MIHTLELTMEEASRILIEHLRLNVPCCADTENGVAEFHLEHGKDDAGYPTCRIKRITVTCNHKQAADPVRMAVLRDKVNTLNTQTKAGAAEIGTLIDAMNVIDNPFTENANPPNLDMGVQLVSGSGPSIDVQNLEKIIEDDPQSPPKLYKKSTPETP